MDRKCAWALLVVVSSGSFVVADDHEDLFEKRIRPVLATRCVSCHGAKLQKGDVRLDSKQHVDAKKLLRLVRGESDAPAVCKLKPGESQAFASWIKAGLPWPKQSPVTPTTSLGSSRHWAFQAVVQPAIPDVKNGDWIRTPVDAFVLAKLNASQLEPSPRADRRTLIRRLSYSLTGLPPTPQAVRAFVKDADPKAIEKLVDRMLDSTQYGGHWARHWLDVARYADTKGYVYAREERFWAHAWAYRDWVVNALNQDLPYDRFLSLQLAADQLVDSPTSTDLAAMGFLTLGRRFLGVERDIFDDRIDVVTRGMLGLTVSCARCHDHMYDPIPTADYYSLYGVFASSQERLVSIGDPNAGGEAFQTELAKRREAVRTQFAQRRDAASKRARERVADYLFAQTELAKYPADGFDQIFAKTDLLPAFAHRWDDFLRKAGQRNDPVFVPWHAYFKLPASDFESQAASTSFENKAVHPIVAAAFETPPKSMRDVADRYGKILSDVDKPGRESLRQIMFGPESPSEVPDLPIVHSERFFDSDSITALYKLEGEVYRWITRSNAGTPHALILEDRKHPVTPRVFIRGNPLKKGEETPRQFLSVLSGKNRKPFQTGSGRLELANAITDPTNPLTARVIVNRVWGHHFGRGLVERPSDFGLRSDLPSHPELLDWLAARFVAEGWSLKKLHRWILLSSTFQQSSQRTADEAAVKRAIAVDPENRLLWRMKARRLSWEQFRDSMLAASQDLDLQTGGKPINLFAKPYPKRRTIYGLVDRQFLPDLLRTFDFANPDLHIAKRSETTVPQQALFFMNDPLVLDRAKALAEFSQKHATDTAGAVRVLFQQVWQRDPDAAELAECLAVLKSTTESKSRVPITAADWTYGYGAFDEKSQRVTGFAPLPHFTGAAWQGGPNWPDAKLGWVQLTATGGHPGNTRSHAAIRRWTAPRAMKLSIDSNLIHEAKPGDGIRAFVVSSRSGLIASAAIHQQTIKLGATSLAVEMGDTIDFVIDIGKVLNSDQYLWQAFINEQPGSTSTKDADANQVEFKERLSRKHGFANDRVGAARTDVAVLQ